MDSGLRSVLAEINKKHGEGTVVLGSDIHHDLIPRLSTGSLALDVALGGGWAANQWNEIIGDESHGKTAVTLKTVAAAQQADPDFVTVWVAAEHFVVPYAEMLGVDVSRVIVVNTNVMEDAFEAILKFLKTHSVDLIVLDSLPALVPGEEAEKAMEDFQMGLGARLTGKFFRKQGKDMKRSLVDEERPVTGIIINQFREKIGVMYGDPKTTPGGKAKNFFYFTRVEVKRDEWIEEKQEGFDKPVRVGQVIKCRTVKNKSHPPQKVAVIDFYFADAQNGMRAGEYDTAKEIIALAMQFRIFERRGAWYTYGDERWNGKSGIADALAENPALAEKIRADVMEAIKS